MSLGLVRDRFQKRYSADFLFFYSNKYKFTAALFLF